GEDRVREGDETDAGGRRGGGEAQEPRGGDEEGRGGAGEGVGAHIAFGGVASGGVGADPGDAVEGGAADLPAPGVEFEADGPAEFVEREVDGAQVVAGGGGGEPGDVAPAGGAGGARARDRRPGAASGSDGGDAAGPVGGRLSSGSGPTCRGLRPSRRCTRPARDGAS